MYEKLIGKVRMGVQEDIIKLFSQRSLQGERMSSKDCRTISNAYMSSFTQNLLRHYRKTQDSAQDRSFDGMICALHRSGVNYKLTMPPLTATFIFENIKISIEHTSRSKRIYIGDQLEYSLDKWDALFIDIIGYIVSEYKRVITPGFIIDFWQGCLRNNKQNELMRTMIRNTVNATLCQRQGGNDYVVSEVLISSDEKAIIKICSLKDEDISIGIRCLVQNLPRCVQKALDKVEYRETVRERIKRLQLAAANQLLENMKE